MDQVRNVSDRLQDDLGPVKRATARRRSWRQRACAALLARLGILATVLVARGLVENVLDLGTERVHRVSSQSQFGNEPPERKAGRVF
ncbi:hypothetical protein MES4922_10234 [Mesorhizobium ventifaucium]|uniref:Uncharacterized protein n=1 Tax=Mesorhizobium ventifaucium TaxID=666020 RepID=A0ABM9DCR5_9HYPH|nr:hypothetical protein MES4922_10234 [Mesorhizobium ventifaucium]